MENDKLFSAFTISKLVIKQVEGKINAVEKEKLDKWLNTSEANQKLFQQLIDTHQQQQALKSISKHQTEEAFDRVMAKVAVKQVSFFSRYKIAISAAAILLVSTLIFTLYNSQDKVINKESLAIIDDVKPGSNKAVLILSDGSQINLSDAQNGTLAEQAGIKVTKTADGQIIYDIQNTGATVNDQTTFNTITTPNGGQYQVRLPDGTRVWLNAASSLKYPTSFSQKERRVELSGEAYFQVAVNKAVPFFVNTAHQEVEVLGTHFNINSYADEEKNVTTLEEGSVKVASAKRSAIIKPGQQTATRLNGEMEIREANLATALAWKDGLIKFKDADIRTIMRQVSRWYNIKVEYKGKVSGDLFTGGVSRTENLSALLKILELNNVHFTITEQPDGKKLIVEP